MPAAFDIRQSIAAALAGFAKRPLPEAATEFFASLGYHSQRRMEYPSLAACLAEFDKAARPQNSFLKSATQAPPTPSPFSSLPARKSPLARTARLSLFKPGGLDPRQFESYLFLHRAVAGRGLFPHRAGRPRPRAQLRFSRNPFSFCSATAQTFRSPSPIAATASATSPVTSSSARSR